MQQLTMNNLPEIRAGKMKSAGIWVIETTDKSGNQIEKIVVRVRKSKREWFARVAFSANNFERALAYFNDCVSEKFRLSVERKNPESALMKKPLSVLIDECIQAMHSRRAEPWSRLSEKTVHEKIKNLLFFKNRFFGVGPAISNINQSISASVKFRNTEIKSLLANYEKEALANAALLIGNMTLTDVKDVARDHDSDNGFRVLLQNIHTSKHQLKDSATTIREFLRFIQRRHDPDKLVTSWFPSIEDFLGLKPQIDKTTKRKTDSYYTETEALKLLNDWKKFVASSRRASKSFCLLFELGLHIGGRIGEISAIRPKDINLSEQTITISRTVTESLSRKRMISDETKTGEERETLVIPHDLLVRVLSFAKSEGRTESDPLFLTKPNSLINGSLFNQALKRACRRSNTRYIPSHQGIRRTFINLAVRRIAESEGGDLEKALKVVAKASGHSVEMCRNTYFVTDDADREKTKTAVLSLYKNADPATAAVDPKDAKIAELLERIKDLENQPLPRKRVRKPTDLKTA